MSQSYSHCSGSKFCLTRRCSLLLVAAVIILLFTGILFLGLICDHNHVFWYRSCSTQTSCSEHFAPRWKGRTFLWAGLHTGLCPRQKGQGKQGKGLLVNDTWYSTEKNQEGTRAEVSPVPWPGVWQDCSTTENRLDNFILLRLRILIFSCQTK